MNPERGLVNILKNVLLGKDVGNDNLGQVLLKEAREVLEILNTGIENPTIHPLFISLKGVCRQIIDRLENDSR